MSNKKLIKKAYSLLELSIVIIIISILIAGALSVSTSGVHNARVKVTQERMREIYKAMGNFLITNRRLPCPAPINAIESLDVNYGVEVEAGAGCDAAAGVFQSTFNVNLMYGMVPTRTLGLSNEMAKDGFDSKITYIIDQRFANAANPDAALIAIPGAEFSTADLAGGVLTIQEKPSAVVQTITTEAIMALVSHGVNKAGAFNNNSANSNARSTDIDENDNDLGAAISAAPIPNTSDFNAILVASAANSDIFDDIVFFKRRNDFIEDFKTMFLIPCNGAITTGNIISTTNAYYEQVREDTSGCTAPTKRTRKCGAFGVWFIISDTCI
jgi:prepilin-type N-terminal cleavage/methylation domain-containing protein